MNQADGEPSSAGTPIALPPGTLLGAYKVVDVLGRGGMGIVYEVLHEALGKRAAIKMLHQQYAQVDDVRQRFLREGRAAARIEHANVVDVYDVQEFEGCPSLVMELLEGRPLADLLERGAIDPRDCADYLIPVMAAVHTGHRLGVIHRDLKPENIFLCSERGGTTRPVVLDFGISKLSSDVPSGHNITADSSLLGTPDYMSPEQVHGARHVNGLSDQYSLGVMLYEMATGHAPFQDESLYGLLNLITHGNCEQAKDVNPAIPTQLNAIIMKAMSVDPVDRFPNVAALGSQLLNFASERTQLLFSQELESRASEPLPEPTIPAPDAAVAATLAAPRTDALGATLAAPTERSKLDLPLELATTIAPPDGSPTGGSPAASPPNLGGLSAGLGSAQPRAISPAGSPHSSPPKTSYRAAPLPGRAQPETSGAIWLAAAVIGAIALGGVGYWYVTSNRTEDDSEQREAAAATVRSAAISDVQSFVRYVGDARTRPKADLARGKPVCKAGFCTTKHAGKGESWSITISEKNEWAVRFDTTLGNSRVGCLGFGGHTLLRSWKDQDGAHHYCKMRSGPLKGLYLWLQRGPNETQVAVVSKLYLDQRPKLMARLTSP